MISQTRQDKKGSINSIRYKTVDRDAADAYRMAPIRQLMLDPVNFASVRRTLADTAHLPSHAARLLLGLDISFTLRPTELLTQMQALKNKQALYMVVSHLSGDKEQCR